MDDEARARTRLRSFTPVFPVRDLRRALAHYAALGFDVTPYDDGGSYGFADRDGVGLHPSAPGPHRHDDAGAHAHAPEQPHHEHGAVAYLYVADADALYDEWARPGIGGLTRKV